MYSIPGFEIKEILNESAHSLFVRAEESASGRSVILKFLNREHPDNLDVMRFSREYERYSRLPLVPGIARVLGIKHHGIRILMIFEDIPGLLFKDYLREDRLSLENFLYVGSNIAEILQAIHNAGIVHGGINPSSYVYDPVTRNICLYNFTTTLPLIKEDLIDIPRDQGQGILAYISPEQTGRTNRRIDWRTDLYSLGITFYEMLTGKLPFVTGDPLEMVHAHIARQPVAPYETQPAIPQIVSSIIMKLLSKNVEDRYQSAAAVRAD